MGTKERQVFFRKNKEHSDYVFRNPALILREHYRAKCEWRIATTLYGRSASRITGPAYSAAALREMVGGKIRAGCSILKDRSLRSRINKIGKWHEHQTKHEIASEQQ